MISRIVLSVTVVGLVAIWWTDVSRAGTTTAAADAATSTAAAAYVTTTAGAASGDASNTASTTAGANAATGGSTATQAAATNAPNNSTNTIPVAGTSTAKNVVATTAASMYSQAPAVQSNTTTVTPISCWQAVITAGNSSGATFNANWTDSCTSTSGICYALYDVAMNTAWFGCTGTGKSCSQNDITKTGTTAAGNQCEFCCTSPSCDDVAKLTYDGAKAACTKLIAQLRNGIDPIRPTTSAISLLASMAAVTIVLLL